MASIARAARPMAAASRSLARMAGGRPHVAVARPARRAFSATAIFEEKKYSKDHEWVELDAEGKTVTIGITKYAAASLGDVVYVELPTQNVAVVAGDAIGAVESVKSASDILTPVTGVVVAANGELEDKPNIINKGPESVGWIARIDIGDESEVEALMDEAAYKAFTEE